MSVENETLVNERRAMLPIRNTLSVCAMTLCALLLPSAVEGALVTHFNFNGYDGDSNTINANSGTAGITLATSGGEVWPANDLAVTTGTDLNRVGTEAVGDALGVQNQNGGTLTIEFESLGYSNLALSFAYERGAESALNFMQLSYFDPTLNDGAGGFANFGSPVSAPDLNNYYTATFDLSSITALNNAAGAQLRLTFSGGSTTANTNLSIDNLQINGAAVPEASQLAMGGIALLLFGGVAYRHRRRLETEQSSPGQVLAA